MRAKRAFHDRALFADGAIIEMTIWIVPEPVLGSRHSWKYSLFYGYPGNRIVGYDNERLKGDHRHLRGEEVPYEFIDVRTLVADFLRDVNRARSSP